MSVPAGTAKVQYLGSGSTGPFAFNFELFLSSHLKVTKTSIAGADTTLVLTTDYTVSIASDFSSATVTLIVPLAGTGLPGASETLTLTRDPPISQLIEWPRNDPFPSSTHERAADLAVMLIDRLNEKISRSLLLPEGSSFSNLQLPNPTANAFLQWNASGTALQNMFIASPGTLIVSPFIQTLLDDVDAATARTTLGLGTANSPTFAGLNVNGTQTNTGTGVGPVLLTLRDTDNGIFGGVAAFEMVSASPAANDMLFQLGWNGRDSLNNSLTYTALRGYISDPTNGSTDGRLTYVRKVNNADVENEIATVGKQSIWIPAAALLANGGTPGSGVLNVGGANTPYLAFDPTASEFSFATIAMPKSWNVGQLSAKVYWTHPATTVNFGVVWSVGYASFGDNEAFSNIYTSATVVDTGGVTSNVYISAETALVTPGGSPASQDMMAILASRVATDGNDTLAVDAYLLGVMVYYTTNAPNDA